MIINAGRRRLVSYRYGWRIEILHRHQKTGAEKWIEDRPAYPDSLAAACELLFERVLKEGRDIDIRDLSVALNDAAGLVRAAFKNARYLL